MPRGFFLAAATQLPGLMHFLAQHNEGNVAAQCHPRNFPIFREREIFSPDWSCPITFRARLSTLCSRCSDEEVPSPSVHGSTSLSQFGLGHETDFRLIQLHLLLPKGANQSPARFERFRRDKGLERHRLRESHRLLPDKEEEKLAVWPIFHRDIPNSWMTCANAQRPMDPGKKRRLPNEALPPSFAKSSRPQCCTPLQPPRLAAKTTNQKPALKWIVQAFQRFRQGRNRVFEMFFPQIQAVFYSAQDIFFARWIIVFLTPVPSRFHCPKAFRFVTLTRFFRSCRLAHFSVVIIQLFRFFPFNSL